MRSLASMSVRIGLVGATAAFIVGCAPVRYIGDGTLTMTKAPSFACEDRFDVDLGPVDFTRSTTMQFHLAGLPVQEYTVGLEIASRTSGLASDEAVRESHKPDPLIELVMRNEKGGIVLNQRGRLSDWVWSGALASPQSSFVYNRGEGRELRVSAITTQGQRVGVEADGGWGTYFTPRKRGGYLLSLAVVEADSRASSYTANLRVRGVVGCL